MRARRLKAVLSIAAFLAAAAHAQTPRTLSIDEAVRFALAHHPSVDAAAANASLAHANLGAARAARLPSLDAELQLNRATANVVTGSSFGLPGVPAIAGPVNAFRMDNGFWGTTGALVSDVPLTGLLRATRTTEARQASERAAQAHAQVTSLDVAGDAAAAYLDALAAAASVRAAEASLARARALLTVTQSLAAQALRPGADVARAQAEVAAAETDVARAERTHRVAQAKLAEAIASDAPVIERDLAVPPATNVMRPANVDLHPAVREAKANVDAAARDLTATQLGYWPQLDLVGALWSRGSGRPVSGVVPASMSDGLNPAVGNWAIGLVLSLPLLGRPAVSAEVERASAQIAIVAARERAARIAVSGDLQAAAANDDGARAVVQLAYTALQDANVALDQAMARFQTGLTSIIEVADAQRLLARADVANALATIDATSARLALLRAHGELDAFLAELGSISSR